MSEENEQHHVHGFGVEIPRGLVRAIAASHDQCRASAEDRHNLAMRWLDGLDVDGLLSLRWFLSVNDQDEAYGNNRYFDGMCVQRLRALGVDPQTGLDPAAQLLETEAMRSPDAG